MLVVVLLFFTTTKKVKVVRSTAPVASRYDVDNVIALLA